MNLFKDKTTMEGAGEQSFCRTDQTSDEARRYQKAPLPGERKNPMLETQSVDRPRKGHGY